MDELTVEDQEFEFEVPPLFAGMMAREYQCGSSTKGIPMRGWGSGEQTTKITYKGREFMVGPHRRNGVTGLRFQIDDVILGTRKTYFVPYERLDTVTLILRGLEGIE